MLRWDMVKELSNAKIIATTSIWVFIVPITLKFLNQDLSDLVSLPQSFSILYFSGVSFFLGAVVYNIFSPSILRQYHSYANFAEKGGNVYLIDTFVKNLSKDESSRLKKLLIDKVGELTPSEIDTLETECIDIGKDADVFTFKLDKTRDVFWIVYETFMTKRYSFILVSLTFHALGFIGLSYIFIKNFILVINSILA
jgi:hypothetical protein